MSDYPIPIHDWLFYVKNISKIYIFLLKSLSEYECMLLFEKIIETKNVNPLSLLNYGITISKWKTFRKNLGKSGGSKIQSMMKRMPMQFFYHYFNQSNKNSFDEKIQEIYKYSITLLGILIGNLLDERLFRPHYFYSWKNLQTFFNIADFPSTKIVTLLVDTLNLHRTFYENRYNLFNDASLPYNQISSLLVKNTKMYKEEIRQYLNNRKDSLLKVSEGDHQLLELIEIDVDNIVKG